MDPPHESLARTLEKAFDDDAHPEPQRVAADDIPVKLPKAVGPKIEIGTLFAMAYNGVYYYGFITKIVESALLRNERLSLRMQYTDKRARRLKFHGGWIDVKQVEPLSCIADEGRNFRKVLIAVPRTESMRPPFGTPLACRGF